MHLENGAFELSIDSVLLYYSSVRLDWISIADNKGKLSSEPYDAHYACMFPISDE